MVNKYGTRDGYVRLCESGYVDGAALISAYLQTAWLTFPEYGDIVRVELEFEMPVNKILDTESYVNMQKDAAKEWELQGETPLDTDTDIRKVVYQAEEMNLRGRFFSYKLLNAENVGADLKINRMKIFYNSRTTKRDISGD
jgi:hypothetical protein